MKNKNIVLIVEDNTTLKCLEPLVRKLSGSNNISYVFLDSLFEVSKSSLAFECREFYEFLNLDHKFFHSFQTKDLSRILQRILADHLPNFIFDFDRFFTELSPDLILSGVDHLLFLRQLFYAAKKNDVTTAVIQQGIHRDHLDPERVNEFLPYFGASYSNKYSNIEQIKRLIAHRFGPTTYTNPYPDFIFTLGDFFTNYISGLRGMYNTDRSQIITTGSPEFDGQLVDYTPRCESVLILGQQLLELPWEWEKNKEERFHKFLLNLNKNIPVTYRPHPKSSNYKKGLLPEPINISHSNSLQEDIEEHDVSLTFYSTAIYQGVLSGNVCGVIQPSWFPVEFQPFTHNHIVQVTDPDIDFRKEAIRRDRNTQQDYISNYCYMPNYDESIRQKSSSELIIDILSNNIC